MKIVLVLTSLSFKTAMSQPHGGYFHFEQACETPSQQVFLAGLSLRDTSGGQLSLALFSPADSLLWFRTYPDMGYINSICQISEDKDGFTLFFNAGGFARSVRYNHEKGELCDARILSKGYLLDVAVSGNSEYMLIQRSDSVVIYTPDTGRSYSWPLAEGCGCLQGKLTVYPNGDVFFTAGPTFGILDHELHPKKVWEFTKLNIVQSLYILPENFIVLGGSEESELFGPKNQQGYLALINAENYNEVLWTTQLGSENEDENIPLITLTPQNTLGFLLKSQNQVDWYTLDLKGKNRKQKKRAEFITRRKTFAKPAGKRRKDAYPFY